MKKLKLTKEDKVKVISDKISKIISIPLQFGSYKRVVVSPIKLAEFLYDMLEEDDIKQ